ncbi:acyclic terpene utilization AtuA family protein [Blastococcus sp. SYSU DS0616]
MTASALRVANCSGFYGDRLSAAVEMVEGGPIDVLTGDYLAELTMLILWKNQQRDPSTGFAKTFLTQMEHVLGTCKDRGIKVVANAGGLNPAGLADAVRALAQRLGISVSVAHIEGDDLLGELPALREKGVDFRHLDTGLSLDSAAIQPVTANAYLGAWGITEALRGGADVVITPRVTDASVVVGPAAWHFGWRPDDWDQLASAVVVGHVLECGAQATGGNYAFWQEIADRRPPGFPLAEIEADGSAVITKHPDTGGLVSVGTVTAQLLYELGGPSYANPDVVARFDTISLTQEGPDRVRVSGIKGDPAPADIKVCLNYSGGYRNSVTFMLTGLDIEEKARAAEEALEAAVGGWDQFDRVAVDLQRTEREDPATNVEATARLVITVVSTDRSLVGRRFSNAATEMGLSSYPGFYTGGPPQDAAEFGVYWPALVPAEHVQERVVVDDGSVTAVPDVVRELRRPLQPDLPEQAPEVPAGETRRIPLGALFGARSGDKGGNANVGLWARSPEAYAWLAGWLTPARFTELFPETADLTVDRYLLPKLHAVNFVVRGMLGEGVASSTRTDRQAKSLGEFVRARVVDVPVALLDGAA